MDGCGSLADVATIHTYIQHAMLFSNNALRSARSKLVHEYKFSRQSRAHLETWRTLRPYRHDTRRSQGPSYPAGLTGAILTAQSFRLPFFFLGAWA